MKDVIALKKKLMNFLMVEEDELLIGLKILPGVLLITPIIYHIVFAPFAWWMK